MLAPDHQVKCLCDGVILLIVIVRGGFAICFIGRLTQAQSLSSYQYHSGVTISKLNRKSQVTMQLRYDLRKVTIREMTISKAS